MAPSVAKEQEIGQPHLLKKVFDEERWNNLQVKVNYDAERLWKFLYPLEGSLEIVIES